MGRFLLLRFLQSVIALFIGVFVVFGFSQLTGDPSSALVPQDATPEDRAAIIKSLGLDKPVMYQFWVYVKNAARGDFGTSMRYMLPVTELTWERVFNTVQLASGAVLLALLIGFPLGIAAAVYRGRQWDRVAMTVALLGQSLPTFFTGLVGILVFAVFLDWLPAGGIGGWKHYILPVATLGWFSTAATVRLLRSSMLEVLDSEYIKLARLKGLAEHVVIWKHALRNALIPVVTFVALMYGILVAGSMTTEVVFVWPGMGLQAYYAVLGRDFPLLQFTVLTYFSVIIILNFLVDMVYGVLDPRIRVK